MSYLLDSNIVIASLNGHSGILARLSRLGPEDIVLCSPVLAELEYGARLSARAQENLRKLDDLIEQTRFISFGLDSARLFGRLKAQLRRQGITKTDFDLAMAAMALCSDLTLVSDDHAFHDGSIAGLAIENWLDGS